MKITPQAPLGSIQINQISNSALQTLRNLVGQTINLNVQDVTQNRANLQFGNQTLQAQTNVDLKPFSQIQAKVTEQNGQLRLIVQVAPKTEPINQSFLRAALPNQMPLNQTLNFLSQPQILQQLPPAIQTTINQILEQILRPALLDARRLEQALRASGQFLENELKTRPGAHLKQDIKANLFRLQQQLQQQLTPANTSTPANRLNPAQPGLVQALTMVQQSIQAIQLNQFQQTEQKDNIISSLAIENQQRVEAIDIEIQRKRYKKQQIWEVILQMGVNLAQTIEPQIIESKISMTEKEEFRVWFYTENQQIGSKIQQNLDTLKKSFNKSGLALNLLQFSAKPLINRAQNQKTNLIDIKI